MTESDKETTYNPPDEELFHSYKDKDGIEHFYQTEEKILAKLLIDDVLLIGDFNTGPFWQQGDNPPPDTTACVYVMCSDIFSWGCADCENITTKELPELYKEHKKCPGWGSTKWVARKRNLQPQRPVVEMMKKEGAWDEEMESLGKNAE